LYILITLLFWKPRSTSEKETAPGEHKRKLGANYNSIFGSNKVGPLCYVSIQLSYDVEYFIDLFD